MSFGAIVAQSSNIVLMRVEAVDKTKNLIVYKKLVAAKGVEPELADAARKELRTLGVN